MRFLLTLIVAIILDHSFIRCQTLENFAEFARNTKKFQKEEMDCAKRQKLGRVDKCFFHCLLDRLNIFWVGKLDKDVGLEIIGDALGEEVATKIITDCGPQADDEENQCEAAVKFLTCYMRVRDQTGANYLYDYKK